MATPLPQRGSSAAASAPGATGGTEMSGDRPPAAHHEGMHEEGQREGTREADAFEGLPPGERVKVYEGPGIQVRYDAGRCRHYAACVRNAPEAFDPERRPWIQPDNTDSERITAAVRACPTGALHYLAADVPAEQPERPTVITPSADGPLLVRGDLRIEVPTGPARELRAALCRCGASANKPFCDGSHERIGWREA